jgi:uncharacterized YigZ family protein
MPYILTDAGEFSFEEKRSKFIAYCEPVETESGARSVLARIRAAHKSAAHHVYAYGLQIDHLTRHSDDGEPQGTAGLPVLNVFIKQNVVDFVCVVTRYFGGTLLGTGGLTRAYGRAAKGALEMAGAVLLIHKSLYTVSCAYAQLAQMKYFFEKNGISLIHIDYGEKCEALVEVSELAETAFLAGSCYTVKKLTPSPPG